MHSKAPEPHAARARIDVYVVRTYGLVCRLVHDAHLVDVLSIWWTCLAFGGHA